MTDISCNANTVLIVGEVIQAGDIHLIKWRCENCEQSTMGDWRSPICDHCDADYADRPLVLPNHRKDYRLLAGTKRKNTISKKIVKLLFEMQEGLCAYCGNHLDDYHVDHIKPISFGGSNNQSNLCLSCPTCNLTAGSLVFHGFFEKRDYIINKRKK